MSRVFTLLAILLFLMSSGAQAYWIGEHETITDQAIAGLQACGFLPRDWDDNLRDLLKSANASEDTNLFRKWTHYSHFYNPTKKLDMYRADSSETIAESAEAIEQHSRDLSYHLDNFRMLGRIIHHLQDATVPPHVVPVAHFLGDGFESYSVDEFPAMDMGTCERLRAGIPTGKGDLLALLKNTALTTLGSLKTSVTIVHADKTRQQLRWNQAFWTEGEGADFGDYGVAGNNFGKSEFVIDDEVVTVNPTIYETFKKQQLARAVTATQAAILWLLSLN